eukprot:2853643-Rhodomonas_salina.1
MSKLLAGTEIATGTDFLVQMCIGRDESYPPSPRDQHCQKHVTPAAARQSKFKLNWRAGPDHSTL